MNLDSFAQTLGDRLRTYRERAGLTQSDVADMLNITAQAYSHYETGRRAPSPDNFYRIAQIYHTSMEYLLTGEQDSSLQLVQQIVDDVTTMVSMNETQGIEASTLLVG